MPIEDFTVSDFSRYGEMMVLFRLEELGWWVYQPVYDRYIDLIALKIVCSDCSEPFADYNKLQCIKCQREVSKHKANQNTQSVKKCPECNKKFNSKKQKCDECGLKLENSPECPYCGGIVGAKPFKCQKCKNEKYRFKIRTIQVKSSRDIDKNHQNFGVKMTPKDLITDPKHFFIWYFVDTKNKQDPPKYLVMTVEDFNEKMGSAIDSYSFKIGQNLRLHLNKKTLKGGNTDWSIFLNKFHKLEFNEN